MQIFVPLDDDTVERWPADARLVPYRPGLTVWSQVTVESDRAEAAATGLSRDRAPADRRASPPARLPCPR